MNRQTDQSQPLRRGTGVAFGFLIVLEGLVLAQALLAWQDHFLTVAQMQQRGIERGLPFVWHFAMWSDAFLISPLAAYLVGRHYRGWSPARVLVSVALGLTTSCILHWTYTLSFTPQAHVHDHILTGAGYGHLIYMAITLAVFAQYLFFTRHVSQGALRTVSVLLLLHVFVGTHMTLGLLNRFVPLGWYPDHPLINAFGWLTIATVALGLLWQDVRHDRIGE